MQPTPRKLALLMSLAGIAALSDRTWAHLEPATTSISTPTSVSATTSVFTPTPTLATPTATDLPGIAGVPDRPLDAADDGIVEAARRDFGFDTAPPATASTAIDRLLAQPVEALATTAPGAPTAPTDSAAADPLDVLADAISAVLMADPPRARRREAEPPRLPVDPGEREAPPPVAALAPRAAAPRPPAPAVLERVLDASPNGETPTAPFARTTESDRVMQTLAAVLFDVDIDLGEAVAGSNAPATAAPDEPSGTSSGDSIRFARAATDTPSQHVLRDLAALRDATLSQATATSPSPAAVPSAERARTASPFGTAVALDEGRLDRMRGGFVTDTGLQISFGIERAVYINGALVTTTSLNVSDLGKVAGGQASATTGGAIAPHSIALIQNGAGNIFVAGAAAGSLGTVVQNTLNDQKIQTLTQINATVNALQMLKALTFQSSLRSAVTSSLQR